MSEVELQKVTAKLMMFEEISARLKSSQSSSEERIVRLEQDLETVQLENIQFRKQINDLRREICPGCALIGPALTILCSYWSALLCHREPAKGKRGLCALSWVFMA